MIFCSVFGGNSSNIFQVSYNNNEPVELSGKGVKNLKMLSPASIFHL